MKKRWIAISATLAVILLLIGIVSLMQKRNTPIELTNPKIIYANAADAAKDIRDVALHITKTLETTVGFETFSETSEYTQSCIGLGSDVLEVAKKEILTVGKHTSEITELFTDDIAYITVNESKFSADITPANYEKRIIPSVLLNYDLYTQISGVGAKDGYVIYLENGTALESWVSIPDATLVTARGTAYVNYSGELTKSVYTAEYTKNNIKFRLSVISQHLEEAPLIPQPGAAEQYVKIDTLDAPKILEQASGYLTQIENILATSKEQTYFEAFGDRRTQEITVQCQKVSGWSANVETAITLSNDGRVGQESLYTQKEEFKNGIYSLIKGNEKPAQNDDITEEKMKTYCQNMLVNTIMLPEYVKKCEVLEENGLIRINYYANDEFALQITQKACQALYCNPELLDMISENNSTELLVGYLLLDRTTMFPVGSGIAYRSTYTAEGLPYQFTFQADQTYQMQD